MICTTNPLVRSERISPARYDCFEMCAGSDMHNVFSQFHRKLLPPINALELLTQSCDRLVVRFTTGNKLPRIPEQ